MDATYKYFAARFKVLTALLLAFCCLSAITLASAPKAWGNEETAAYAAIYKKANAYTLVIQSNATGSTDSEFGERVAEAKKPFEDNLRISELLEELLNGKDVSKANVSHAVFRGEVKAPRSLSALFANCSDLNSIDLRGLDTSQVTNMEEMFYGCSGLKSLDLSGLDTSKVTSMYQMFRGCSKLESLNLTGLHTSNVESMEYMFWDCSGLKSLDLSWLDASNLTYVGYMFGNCSGLTSLDLTNFKTGKSMREFAYVIYGCEALSSFSVWRSPEQLGWLNLPNAATWYDESGSVVEEGIDFRKLTPGRTYVFSTRVGGDSPAGQQPVSGNTGTSNGNSAAAALTTHSITNAVVTVKSRAFTGKVLKPSSVTVKLGGKLLKQGTDYTVSCKGGKAVGSYTVTIKGKGPYAGSKTAAFKIVPKAVSETKAVGAKKALKVTWKKPSKAARAQVTGYQMRYSAAKSMKGAKTVKVKGSTKTSATVKKLKGGKKYYVQVRAYKTVKGKTYYSAWSSVKPAKAKK